MYCPSPGYQADGGYFLKYNVLYLHMGTYLVEHEAWSFPSRLTKKGTERGKR